MSKLIQSIKELRASLTLLPIAAIGFFLVWFLFAPRPECYYQKGQCVYFVTQNSDFFIADLWFALPALVLGLVFGFAFGKSWYKAGILFQALVAVITTGLSYLVVLLGALASPAERISSQTRISNLELRAVGALFIWAFVIQMVIVFRGEDRESESDFESESD
jgi:hypothetical protein